jgi:GNAT superfamily N-acetyltransferase
MDFTIRVATGADVPAITELIAASVRGLQPEYTARQREAALATVFTVDSRLIADGTYFVALADGVLAGCGGWSFRKTLYGGDHQVERAHGQHSGEGILDPLVDAAKIRAIFVHPAYARMGLGAKLLRTAEDAAVAAGFSRFEMGSTLAGVVLYRGNGYGEAARIAVPVGDGESITVVRMTKRREG